MFPKVSVLMPAYNAEKYIGEAIESILAQSFADFEFIIIDDASTDNSWGIIQEYAKKDTRIIAVKNTENLRICKTLNKGIEMIQGVYIARMDSDDISFPDRFEKQVQFLDENPDVGILGGSIQIMDEAGIIYSKREYNLTDKKIRDKIFRYSPFCHPAVMIRNDILKKTDGYDENQVFAEDYDLYFRIGKYSKFANMDSFILKYRMSSSNSTTTKLREMELKTLQIRKKAVKEYGYKMSLWDNIYWTLQYISMYLIPGKFKIWLFNIIRNAK